MNLQSQLRSSAIIIEFSAGVWTANKLDRKVSGEVNTTKRSKKDAARVYKSMLPGVESLKTITAHVAATRNWLYANTKPWSDLGARLALVPKYVEVINPGLEDREKEFRRLVDVFIDEYPLLISAQAFALGDMFDREEYPLPDAIRQKFYFSATPIPVPEAGDFRVDLETEGRQILQQQMQADMDRRVEAVMADARESVLKQLKHVVDRLGYGEDGKPNKFWDSMLDNLAEIIADTRGFNFTKDSVLDALLADAERAVANVTPDELRKNRNIRDDVRARVQEVVDVFGL
jgi:hypothetical protein